MFFIKSYAEKNYVEVDFNQKFSLNSICVMINHDQSLALRKYTINVYLEENEVYYFNVETNISDLSGFRILINQQ